MNKKFQALILICVMGVMGACAPSAQMPPIFTGTAAQSATNNPAEHYNEFEPNPFVSAEEKRTQAFSLKVDTASYSNVARYINTEKQLPPAQAVRTEELINYFHYEGEMPSAGGHPFSVYTKVAKSPFSKGKHIAFIRIKTPEIPKEDLPPSNITFLIDTSGSMLSYNKLPLLQQAFRLLAENLTENDVINIVTYAGSAQVVLQGARGHEKEKIVAAINSLEAGGSTAGAEGIKTAYRLAEQYKLKNGNNRVVLATDGDFNVGISDTEELKSFISAKRDTGVYLSVLGFGTGNIRDDIMETLAANGNGNYSYIDALSTAQKVLVEEMGANLFVVANDVKAELRFNPEAVASYRLIGYESRLMSSEEFNDEKKDAGEIGAGTDVVVLVEVVLKDGVQENFLDVCIRYKTADAHKTAQELVVPANGISAETDTDFNFACAVAGFAEILRGTGYNGSLAPQQVLNMAMQNRGKDEGGYRLKFIELLNAYMQIKD